MRRPVRIALLVAAAGALALLLHLLRLPAAWLFGPLVASAFWAVRGWEMFEAPSAAYLAAQALVGAALGAGFLPETLRTIPGHAGIFSFAVVFILAASLLNGWILTRIAPIDPGSAFLGTMPGGAGAMAAMSDSLGADTRLVTAMQYLRILVILGTLAVAAPLLARFGHLATAAVPSPAPAVATELPAWERFGLLSALAFAGWLAGRWTPIPAGTFLVPTLGYFALTLAGLRPGSWPWPVLMAAYGLMGLQIGGRFHPETIRRIGSVIVPVVGTTLLLLAASAALAWIVSREMGISLPSAYLAATPGGLDSVAAVATSLGVDTTVVLAMHLVRLLCVLLAGPWLVRAAARLSSPAQG